MCIHYDLAHALETLELLGPSGQRDFLMDASLKTRGFFKTTRPSTNWGTQIVEVKAYNLFAYGADLSEAIRNWRLVAVRQVNMQRRVRRAEYVLRQPLDGNSTDVLRKACQTILADSRDEAIRNAARTTLTDLDAIA